MQCYTGQLASGLIPGLSTVTLQTCPKIATKYANIDSESVIDIPGLKSQTFSIKTGQCANDEYADLLLVIWPRKSKRES